MRACRVHNNFRNASPPHSQELFASGIANTVSAFFGAMPTCGGPARSLLNVSIGVRTPLSGVRGAGGGCTRCDIRLHPKPVSDISFFLAMFERSFFSHVLESARPHLCDPPTTIDCVAILMARWCCLFVLLVTKHNQRRCVGGGILILQNMHHKFHNSFSLDLYEVHVKIPVAGMGGFQWLAWVVCAHQGVW